jgi:TldD protein
MTLNNPEAILEAALANGGDFAELFIEDRSRSVIRFENGQAERVSRGTDVGAAVRTVTGDHAVNAYTNDIGDEGLLRAAQQAAAGSSGPRIARNYAFTPVVHDTPVRIAPNDVSTTRMVALARELDKIARAHDPRIAQVTISCACGIRRVLVINSRGVHASELRPRVMIAVQAVARDGAQIQTGYHAVGAAAGFEFFDVESPEEIALKAARQACLMLEADPAPTGKMPVVISCEAGGTMVHEAVGHGLEADHIEKGLSKFCGCLGREIASPLVSVADDPSLPGRYGSYAIDDEGTPTRCNMLIEKGVLTGFLNDSVSAAKLGVPPSGNGRRESFECRPIPRMSNTFILPGPHDPAEILASTDSGLFVRKMGGGQVNPLNGDYVFEVAEGYIIRNGKIETPVRGAVLLGNGPESMQRIDMLGTDLGFGIGTCGKQGQGAPVADAQPTLRIESLTIGGTA